MLVRHRLHSERHGEEGIIITLVAVFMASVVVVMAALAIDVTSLYTARSEAQIAADGAALAGARVLANSGLTSLTSVNDLSPPFPLDTAESLATTVAVKVAGNNPIGGKNLSSSGTCGDAQISVCFTTTNLSNPRVTVKVTRNDLPTFFLRFWNKQLTVSASATAEAYNPSGGRAAEPPIAPLCVKPWVLPNEDPTRPPPQPQLFQPSTGDILNPALIGKTSPTWAPLLSQTTSGAPIAGKYYAAAVGSSPNELPVPTKSLPSCSTGFNSYQLAIAGCVSTPIACGQGQKIRLDTDDPNRDAETLTAVECLLHSNESLNDTDQIDGTLPNPPFEFIAGNQNPITAVRGEDILVSDSLVTIPVYQSNASRPPNSSVVIIGFLQVFLNPQGAAMYKPSEIPPPYSIPLTIVNEIGCSTNATGTPVYGNGPSAIPVRLITPPPSQ